MNSLVVCALSLLCAVAGIMGFLLGMAWVEDRLRRPGARAPIAPVVPRPRVESPKPGWTACPRALSAPREVPPRAVLRPTPSTADRGGRDRAARPV